MELHFPWLEVALLTLLVGAAWVSRLRDPERSRRATIAFTACALMATIGAWIDYAALPTYEAHDGMDALVWAFGADPFVIDELNAPLLPLAALLHLLTAVATLRSKVRRFSFAGMLFSEFILLATFALNGAERPALVALLAVGVAPPYIELRARGRPTRAYVLHAALFVALIVSGEALFQSGNPELATAAAVALMGAVLVRSGIAPAHTWVADLFERASFGAALLFVAPMAGAFAAVRLVLPIAPDWVLRVMAIASLTTAVYAAGMALVQREARRLFSFVFLSHSSLVLVGLEIATPIGLTGGLCVWLSVGLALGGLGLTLRSIEARAGRLSLDEYHGLGGLTPALAGLFLLTGLASVGFPGTIGFVGMELLIEGAVQLDPVVGVAVVVAAALNGIAVLQTYFRLFAGRHEEALPSFAVRRSERLAVLVLAALILGGGLWPQPGIGSRYHAAAEIARSRPSFKQSQQDRSH